MFAQPLTGSTTGVGGIFMTNGRSPVTAPPIRFLRMVIFLKITRPLRKNFYGQTTETTQLS